MFDILLSLDGSERSGMLLVIDEHLHAVLPAEPLDQPFAVFISAANKSLVIPTYNVPRGRLARM
jgi:hypothetical protein